MAVDAGLWLSRRPQTDPQLRADARGRDGGVRQKLAVGVVLRSGGTSAVKPRKAASADEYEARRGPGASSLAASSPCRRPGRGTCCKHQCMALRSRWAAPPRRQRGLINVRFAPKATDVLRCRELPRCATADIEPAPALDAAVAAKKGTLFNPGMVEKLQSFRHGRNVRRRSSQAK